MRETPRTDTGELDSLVEQTKRAMIAALFKQDGTMSNILRAAILSYSQGVNDKLLDALDAAKREVGERACDWDSMREIKEFEALYQDVRQQFDKWLLLIDDAMDQMKESS